LFNFSANHILVTAIRNYQKCSVYFLQDLDTKRCYKSYDYTMKLQMVPGRIYCVNGKINSADKLYLVLEGCKPDTRYINNIQLSKSKTIEAPAKTCLQT
jgi:hypothetical protein